MLKKGVNRGHLFYLEGTQNPKRGLMGKKKKQLEKELKETQKEYDETMKNILDVADSLSVEEAAQQIKPFEDKVKEIKLELEKEVEKHEKKGNKKSTETSDSGVQEKKAANI